MGNAGYNFRGGAYHLIQLVDPALHKIPDGFQIFLRRLQDRLIRIHQLIDI